MATTEIERGWTVYSEDNKRVGDVVEVHPHYLLVSRGLVVVRDVYVPRYAVASAEDRKVRLAITDERLRKMGWSSPPPAPPEPVDGPTPRIVPPVESDATDAFPPFFDDPGGTPLAGDDAVEPDDDPFANFLTPAPVDDNYEDDYEDMGVFFGSTIEVDGGAYLAVRQLGEGPAVVLVHGWGIDRRVWDYLTLDLPRSHNVVTYDARGYGGSTAPWGGDSTEQASRDLRVILRTLDLRDATIVALDSGAATALHYVLSGGRRATRLILIAPAIPAEGAADNAVEGAGDMMGAESAAEGGEDTTGAGNGGAPDLATRDAAGLPEGADIAPVQTHDMPEDAAGGVSGMAREWDEEARRDRPRLAARLATLWAPDASPETQAWLGEGVLAAAPHALLDGLHMLATPDLGGALADVSLPTTVLVGRDDPLAPLAATRALVDAIPGARLVMLDTPGHLPMLSDPARVAAEIRTARDIPDEGSSEEQKEQGAVDATSAAEPDAGDATSAAEPDTGDEAIGAE